MDHLTPEEILTKAEINNMPCFAPPSERLSTYQTIKKWSNTITKVRASLAQYVTEGSVELDATAQEIKSIILEWAYPVVEFSINYEYVILALNFLDIPDDDTEKWKNFVINIIEDFPTFESMDESFRDYFIRFPTEVVPTKVSTEVLE